MSEWHVVLGLIGSIADHESLISSPNVLLLSVDVHSFCDLTRLLVQRHNHSGCFVVHPDFEGIVANFLNGLSDDLLDVGLGFGADLSENHADGVFDSSLACDHGVGILGKTGI